MIAMTFGGPSYFSPNHDETTIEVFPDLGAVIDALIDRHESNGARYCGLVRLDGEEQSTRFPLFDDITAHCYVVPNVNYRQFVDGTHVEREDIITNVLTAVHGQHWDYKLDLLDTGDDDLHVAVRTH